MIIGSAAASWQASIGSVAAGSMFAILQSLGATGLGILLFGSVGAGLGLLTSSAAALGWCTCDSDSNKKVQEPLDHANAIDKSDKENVGQVEKEVVVKSVLKTDVVDSDKGVNADDDIITVE